MLHGTFKNGSRKATFKGVSEARRGPIEVFSSPSAPRKKEATSKTLPKAKYDADTNFSQLSEDDDELDVSQLPGGGDLDETPDEDKIPKELANYRYASDPDQACGNCV